MYYNSILSSVNYVFDWCYSPGRNLGREFLSSESPNEKTKKTSYAYGAMTDASFQETPTPVEMKVMDRARAEEAQNNKPVSTENHDQVVPTFSKGDVAGFEITGDEYTGFYEVQAAGDVNEDEGDFVIGW